MAWNWNRLRAGPELLTLLHESPSVTVPESRRALYDLILPPGEQTGEVGYPVEGEWVTEATLTRCRNGTAINYPEPAMRRRDPDCLSVADDGPTDRPRFTQRYGRDFSALRRQTLDWLGEQDILLTPFSAGGYPGLLICPKNAAFFAYALARMQKFIPLDGEESFSPACFVYVAPPFRHSRFGGRQAVVHVRGEESYEIFAYDLYPGPSAKKGIYGFLLDRGEREGWVTLHAAAARIVTPYENRMVMLHEGASGGGKSELLLPAGYSSTGQLLVGEEPESGKRCTLRQKERCVLEPVCDDMALCRPERQTGDGKLTVEDGEDGWFLRVDGITSYGCVPEYEKLILHTPEPLLFFNLRAVPGADCLPWDHVEDAPGVPCPNPRVILPREHIPRVVTGPVQVDVRSFGVRVSPASRESPGTGILGLMQVLPPALAWLWRLTAPRGYHNPSVTGEETLAGEGVGTYWPFCTGERDRQAQLLLDQLLASPDTCYILLPGQHIGSWRVGFAPEWIAREYLARRGGGPLPEKQLTPARCPLLGWSLRQLRLDGEELPDCLLRPELQPELGTEGYDRGARLLRDFFRRELAVYDRSRLSLLGREILACFDRNGTVAEYAALTKENGEKRECCTSKRPSS